MSLAELMARAGSACELCGGTDGLAAFEVAGGEGASADREILACAGCRAEIEAPSLTPNHWRGLADSMWSPVPAVQVMAWRLLDRLSAAGEGWAQDLRDQLYLDDATMAWAQAGAAPAAGGEVAGASPTHRDSNGVELLAGDTVVLIKDLDVKGAGFTAKRGTSVRNISLVPNMPTQIEGRVNGQEIVLLTQFVKKAK